MNYASFCADAADQRRHQDRIDAMDDLEELVVKCTENLAEEIRFAMLAGMGGTEVQIPFVSFGHAGINDVERSMPIDEAVVEALDHPSTHALLMEALEKSVCPIIKQLRLELAETAVRLHARDVAEFRAGM